MPPNDLWMLQQQHTSLYSEQRTRMWAMAERTSQEAQKGDCSPHSR